MIDYIREQIQKGVEMGYVREQMRIFFTPDEWRYHCLKFAVNLGRDNIFDEDVEIDGVRVRVVEGAEILPRGYLFLRPLLPPTLDELFLTLVEEVIG